MFAMANEPDHDPSFHTSRWHKKHPKAQIQRSQGTPITATAPGKRGWRRFGWPVLATGTNFVLTIVVAKGYLQGIPDLFLAMTWIGCAVFWVVAEGHAPRLYRRYPVRSTVLVVICVVVFSCAWKYRLHWPGLLYQSKDAPYVPPSSHRAIRVDGQVKPTPQACMGLSEEKEIECLCPRPVDYVLNALPTPPDNNYATQVDIKAGRDPMYRVQLFGRTQMYSGKIGAFPHEKEAAISVAEMDYDRYTLLIQSSSPQQEFKLEVRSSEGLRLKCINQIN
jgi:hypothetical protein